MMTDEIKSRHRARTLIALEGGMISPGESGAARIGILVASDRASRGEYEDQSG